MLITGRGAPVTVLAHGLGGSIEDTRPFGSGVAGTRVFFHFRGHGPDDGGQPAGRWDYAGLAAELLDVADRTGATRAFGVSLGAGALLHSLTQQPERFERIVLALPAALDQRWDADRAGRLARLADAARAGDEAELVNLVLADLPSTVRGREDARAWAQRRARTLARPGLIEALESLPATTPVAARAQLARCDVPVLVLGVEADAAHPAALARDVAAALPRARAEVVGAGDLLWDHRQRVRELITGFLNNGHCSRGGNS